LSKAARWFLSLTSGQASPSCPEPTSNSGDCEQPSATSSHKNASSEAGNGASALVTPSPDLTKAARWFLSLSSGQASVTGTSPVANSGVGRQSPETASGEVVAATGSTQEGKVRAIPEPLFDATTNRENSANSAADGVTQGTVDAAPFAELSLTPAATETAANRVTTARSSAFSAQSPAAPATVPRTVSEVGSQPRNAVDSPAASEIRPKNFTQGSESSLDLSSNGPKEALAVPKKKTESGSAQSGDFALPSDRGGNDQREVTSPTASLAPESQKASNTPDPPAATSIIPEPTTAEATKPAGSSVGTIEMQIKSANDSSVGLRFVERQGSVEIQLKSGDPQTAQALSENLAGLKTSLNETGWDVQTRFSSAGQANQNSALDQHMRAAADQSGLSQLSRADEVGTVQTNRQSGSDSSAGQDHSRSDRDDSSGRNGQQRRNDSAGADSQRQGKRSAGGSEAWLESMESDLTRSSAGQVTTGVTK
jgi:hypothetical protein